MSKLPELVAPEDCGDAYWQHMTHYYESRLRVAVRALEYYSKYTPRHEMATRTLATIGPLPDKGDV